MTLKEILNFPDYFAGSDGNIYSKKRGDFKRLKPAQSGNGNKYLFVSLCKNGKRHLKLVHRLICEAFNGVCPSKHECSHQDGNQYNNVPENLKWETRSENLQKRKLHGTDDRGFKNSRSCITPKQLTQIKYMLSMGHTQDSIAEEFGISQTTIYRINKGVRYV